MEDNGDNNNINGKKLWSANFNKKSSDTKIVENGNIVIDAMNEAVVSANKYDNNYNQTQDNAPKVTWEVAYQKALDAIAKYYPDKVKNIKTEQINQNINYLSAAKIMINRDYYFNFQRIVDGATYNNNSINISINTQTGLISNIGYNWDDSISFPSTSGAMGSSEAKK